MEVTSKVDEFLAKHREALFQAENDIGEDVLWELRDSISTLYPPHSTPGQPPHVMSGALYGGLSQHTEANETGAKTNMTSSRDGDYPVPEWLEGIIPNPQMEPRPYMKPMLEEWSGKLLPVAKEKYMEKFSL